MGISAIMIAAVGAVALPPLELDYSPLPPAWVRHKAYGFEVLSVRADGRRLQRIYLVGVGCDSDDLVGGYCSGFRDDGWEVRQRGMAIVILNHEGVPIRSIEVIGKGPRPFVRWAPAPRIKG